MLNRIIHFIKYNNAVVFIVLFVFLLGSGVFAQSEAGKEMIGQKQTRQEGVDNTLLLEADLDTFDMDFQIEKIEEDEFYYYVTYTFLDLSKEENVWQYQVKEKVRKVTKLLRRDLGNYIAEELEEQYQARLKDLKKEKSLAEQDGESTRSELSEYNGLIGQSLELASKVFPGYEPVKRSPIPSPAMPALLSLKSAEDKSLLEIEDSISRIYSNYIAENDPDGDGVFGTLDNCPLDYNPLQEDKDGDGIGDACDNRDDSESNSDVTETDSEAGDTLDVVTEDSIATTGDELTDDNASATEEILPDYQESPTGTGTEEVEDSSEETEQSESNEEGLIEDTEALIEEDSGTEEEKTVEIISEDEVEIIEIN